MTTRKANLEKKWRKCLRCGRKLFSDRCHRTCVRCRDDNSNRFERKPLRVAGTGKTWNGLDDLSLHEDIPLLMAVAEEFEDDF